MTGKLLSKHERAYLVIRQRILDGTYGPGHRLVIDALADELGVSPVPVREAIRRLEAERQVVYRHNAGARVAPVDGRRRLCVGIDVGNTATACAVMDGRDVVAAATQPALPDATESVAATLEVTLRQAHVPPSTISAVIIGTTHFAGVFAARHIVPTACIRLGLPASAALPPMVDWPDDLRAAIGGRSYMAHGGHEVDGRVLSQVDEAELRTIAADLRAAGVTAIAISAIFSPLTAAAEEQAAAVLQTLLPEAEITLSHQVGRLGLLERENAAIINACLRDVARATMADLRSALSRLGLVAPFYLTQNDGTLMSDEVAARFPVLTFSAGQANSIRGAGFLARVRDAIVVDVGGATAHVGELVRGFPRETARTMIVSGVRTNLRRPDVLAVSSVADGSITTGTRLVSLQVGGRSSAGDALVLGSQVFTATGAVMAADPAEDGDATRTTPTRAENQAASGVIGRMVRDAIARVSAPAARLPVVLVGQGAPLVRDDLTGYDVIVPEYHAVAHAVGAATAPVSGAVDRVVSLAGISRREVMAMAVADAVGRAVAAGADSTTVEIVRADDLPLTYLPGHITHVQVKAVGELTAQVAYER